MKLREIQVDAERETQGIWREYLDTGFRCLIARIGNEDAVAERRRLERDYRQAKGLRAEESLPEEDDIDIGRRVASKFLVRDWSGLTDEGPDGEDVDIPYTPEKALEYLRDPKMRKWREWVIRCAQEDAEYSRSMREGLAKN